MEIIEQIGSYAGLASIVGLAILSALYFSQARDVKRLREWAGRAPERAADQAAAAQPVPGRVTAQPQSAPGQQAPRPGAPPPVPAAAAAAGARPAATAPAVQGRPAPAGANAGNAAGAPTPATANAAATPPATQDRQPAPAVAGAGAAGVPTSAAAATPADAGGKPGTADQDAAKPGAPAEAAAKASAPAAADAEAATMAPARPGGGGATAPAPTRPGGPEPSSPAATPPSAPGGATPSAPAVPAVGGPARPGAPATPAAARPQGGVSAPAGTPPGSPVRAAAPARSSPQQTVILPPPREPWYRRLTASPRYLTLAIAGVLIVGGGAAFGIVQLVGEDEGGGSAQQAPTEPAGGGSAPDKDAEQGDRRRVAVNPASVTVAVLNGTLVPGLAAQIGDRVERFGFTLGTVANGPDQQRAESVVMYSPGHRREAAVVSRRLGIGQRERVDPQSQGLAGDATVVVIAGADKTQ
jgi:hypothetical protein